MNIALIGYGKMGKTIEAIIEQEMPEHQVVLKIDRDNQELLKPEHLSKADVAIEFSTPDSAVANIWACFEADVPVAVGTTGWLDKLPELKAVCEKEGKTLLWASNFSVGVNIFFALNRKLAELMNGQKQYQVAMEEIHHTQKLDSPSGTAITLANSIIDELPQKTGWVNESTNDESMVPIISKRIDKVPGTHEITYNSSIDSISIKHTAHSRLGFAYGAIMAAAWLKDRQGYFEMKDVLAL